MIARFIKSVSYALKGIGIGIAEERNIRIDLVAMVYVFYFSTFYNFSKIEYIFLIIICSVIPAFEMMNTAIERAVKNPSAERYMIAGEAKDTAAGGVMLAALGALLAGVLLFWEPAVIEKIIFHFRTSSLSLITLVLSLLFSYFFITIDKYAKNENKK